MEKRTRNILLAIATIIFFVGLGVTIYLVKLNQDIRKKASSGAACQQSGDCVLLNGPGNSGDYTAPRNILYIDITNQTEFRFNPGNTNDGCYNVQIQGNQLTWSKIGSGASCRDISNIQIWMGNGIDSPTPTPTTPQSTVTPTLPPGQTATPTPTRNPSFTATPTTQVTLTSTPSPSATKTGTFTPTAIPTDIPRGGGDTPTNTPTPTAQTTGANTATPTNGSNPTNTPTSGVIAAMSPTPGQNGDALPQAGVGTFTWIFSGLSMIALFGGILLIL
jgi:hypothetical protein